MNVHDPLSFIDPLTGQASFTIPLLRHPQPGGLDISLTAGYFGGILDNATTFNQKKRTGLLGLGWSIGRDRIVAQWRQSTLAGDARYIMEFQGVRFELLCTKNNPDGTSLWATSPYRFFRIVFSPVDNRWTLQDENGLIYTFGEASSGRGTVDWLAAWGGWTGPNNISDEAHLIPSAWSLSTVEDILGRRLMYSYYQDMARVSASCRLQYTRGSYLVGVNGTDGVKLTLQYGNKERNEYAPSHMEEPDGNGRQECYERFFLQSAALVGAADESLGSVAFAYAARVGSEDLAKRLLTAITRLSSAGHTESPPFLFSYYGEEDGVSIDRIFSGGALYGSIKAVTLPEGGTVDFSYNQTSLAYANRTRALTPKAEETGQYLLFADDHILSVCRSGARARVVSHVWEGRWLSCEVLSIPLGDSDYDNLKVATGIDCCAACLGSTLYTAARDSSAHGRWYPQAEFTLKDALAESESLIVKCGRKTAAVLGRSSGMLLTFRFTGEGAGVSGASGWVADAGKILGVSGSQFSMDVQGGVLAAISVAAEGQASFQLKQRLLDGEWSEFTRLDCAERIVGTEISLWCGRGFATASWRVSSFGEDRSCCRAFWWDADGKHIREKAFSSVGGGKTVPVPAGSTVVFGYTAYRFTGAGWKAFPLAKGEGVLPLLSVGSDSIARSFKYANGESRADLLVFNPLTGDWDAPEEVLATGTGGTLLASVTSMTRYRAARHAVVGNRLWHCAADGSWDDILTLPAGMTASDMDSICLIGDSLLIFQTGTDGGETVVYAYLLENGKASLAASSPISGRTLCSYSGGRPAASPVGFALQGNDEKEAESIISLYRPVFGDVTGEQTGCVTASVVLSGGYGDEQGICGRVPTSFAYQKGTIGRNGSIPLFNVIKISPGSAQSEQSPNGSILLAHYNGLTPDEAPEIPYPNGTGNASDYGVIMLGAAYSSSSFAAGTGQTPVSRTAMNHRVTACRLGENEVAYYHRVVRIERELDGVGTAEDIEYAVESGLPRSRSITFGSGNGGFDVFSETYSYFTEKYGQADLNLLSLVVERIRYSQPATEPEAVVIGTDIITWCNLGGRRWVPERHFVGLHPQARFSSWKSDETPPDKDFYLQARISGWNEKGLPTEVENAHAVPNCIVYDMTGSFAVAEAANCSRGQVVWYGAERYESSDPWTVNVPGLSITDYITEEDCHSGSRSILLPARTPETGPRLTRVPNDPSRLYIFSCRAKAPADFDPQQGKAQWRIQFFHPDTLEQVGSPVVLDLTPSDTETVPDAVDGWSYFQVTMDVPSLCKTASLDALGICIQAVNANQSRHCLVDELRFMPLDCGFRATTRAHSGRLLTAVIDQAGQTTRMLYDKQDKHYLTLDPNDHVENLIMSGYSRWILPKDSFQPQFPNTFYALSSSINSHHCAFSSDDCANWKLSDEKKWSFSGGTLHYTGGEGAGSAVSTRIKAANLAARVTVVPMAQIHTSVGLGNGKYEMCWTTKDVSGGGVWTLEDKEKGKTLAVNGIASFQPDWLFTVIDGVVIAQAGSVPLFVYTDTDTSQLSQSGYATLTATAAATFENFVVLEDPSFVLRSSDGLGRPCLTAALLGFQPDAENVLYPGEWVLTASHTFYDSLGRPWVSGQSLEAPLKLAIPDTNSNYSLILADQDTYLYEGDGQKLTVREYLKGETGRTYARIAYESSPVSRIAELDLPRASEEEGTPFCIRRFEYGKSAQENGATRNSGQMCRVQSELAVRKEPGCAETQETVITVLNKEVIDPLGRLREKLRGPEQGTLLRTGFAYDIAGRLSRVSHPNSFAPPEGSKPADWQDMYTYDFLGRLKSHTSPDSGQRQWEYDRLGRPRFLLLPGGVPVKNGETYCILYKKYDRLNRVVETGCIQDSGFEGMSDALRSKCDSVDFPKITDSPTGEDEARGTVLSRYHFDADDSFDKGVSYARFLIGRVTAISLFTEDGTGKPDRELYAYDASGNVVTKSVLMPDISPESGWTTRIAYDLKNRAASIEYPDLSSTRENGAFEASSFTVGYGFDRFGRLAAVGGQPTGAVVDPSHPPLPLDMTYAGYAYNTFNKVQTVQYNNGGSSGQPIRRDFRYDGYRRLVESQSPYFNERYSYVSDNTLDGWSYFGSAVTKIQTVYPGWEKSPCPPSDLNHSFTYDAYGRLVLCETDSSANVASEISDRDELTYDANGNIVTRRTDHGRINYEYASCDGRATNRPNRLLASFISEADFTKQPPILNGWHYESDNGGVSTSGVTDETPVKDGARALRLTGGWTGHHECLRLSCRPIPGSILTLQWNAATDEAYDPSNGKGACWFGVIYDGFGPISMIPLGVIEKSSSWKAGTARMDVSASALSAGLGNGEDISRMVIELRGCATGLNGEAGPAVYVKNVGLTSADTSVAAAVYEYDADGRVSRASGRNIAAIDYEKAGGLTSKISFGSEPATAHMSFAYGANGRRSRVMFKRENTGQVEQTVNITGPDGTLLASRTEHSDANGSSVSFSYFIHGAEGLLGIVTGNGGPSYCILDRLGSWRAKIDAPSGELTATEDFGSFGQALRLTGKNATNRMFAGLDLDFESGLYNAHARLYDPFAAMFYTPDPAREFPASYCYVGNNPVNLVDTDGLLSKTLNDIIDANFEEDDFWVVRKLFTNNNRTLLDEYYRDGLSEVWDRMFQNKKIVAAFGRGGDEMLNNFTQSSFVTNYAQVDAVIYYPDFTGQANNFFEPPENRPYFNQFLINAMNKSDRIYANIEGLLARDVLEVAFCMPDAVLHFFDVSGGYNNPPLNSTSIDRIAKIVPEIKTLKNCNDYTVRPCRLYKAGHTAWELATIITSMSFRNKTTFFNNTETYNYNTLKRKIQCPECRRGLPTDDL